MAEVSADATAEQVPGRSPGRPPVVDISQWVERFSLMAAVIATRFPHKAPELFAYQATIVRAERNYEAGRWVAYDRQFRREALSRRDLNLSTTDPRLYSEAFTGRAKSIPRCTYCLQDDHPAQRCPQNPDQPWTAWVSHGRDHQEYRTPSLLAAPWNSAGATTRGVADLLHAVMGIAAEFVGGRIRQSPVDRVTSAHAHLFGHQHHRPEGRGLQQGTELFLVVHLLEMAVLWEICFMIIVNSLMAPWWGGGGGGGGTEGGIR